jgi:hypothetical protein
MNIETCFIDNCNFPHNFCIVFRNGSWEAWETGTFKTWPEPPRDVSKFFCGGFDSQQSLLDHLSATLGGAQEFYRQKIAA